MCQMLPEKSVIISNSVSAKKKKGAYLYIAILKVVATVSPVAIN